MGSREGLWDEREWWRKAVLIHLDVLLPGGAWRSRGAGGQGEGERERRGLTSITRRLQPGVGEDEDTDAHRLTQIKN